MIEYRDVPDFPGYRVGEDGTVLSNNRPKYYYTTVNGWYQLVPALTTGGRNQVTLCRDKKKYSFFVYTLVLTAFVGDCPDGMVAAHDDGDCTNDNLYNLRWDTQKNNIADKELHGTKLFGERHPGAKLSDDAVRVIRIRHLFGETTTEIAKDYGVERSAIRAAVAGKTWRHVK